MNGALHLGHAFTITKIEFAAGYQRLLGKRVLFPHGFHVTGLPIKVSHASLALKFYPQCSQAAADKLVREIDMFGPDFERYSAEAEEESKPAPVASAPAVIGKATKGKLNAKSTGLKYQFQILEAIGIPRGDIKKFADAQHWLTYFPPQCIVRASISSTKLSLIVRL